MAQTNTIVREINKLSESDAQAVLDFISQLLSDRKPRSTEKPRPDDLIGALSEAHENRRARQVAEWDRVRRTGLRNLDL